MIEKRFWDKVNILTSDECWNWLAADRGNGYGAFKFRDTIWGAHRVAWTFTNGEIPKGLLVCHSCDNRGCCNPNHLFLGTYKDNVADMINKGRGSIPQPNNKGELHSQNILTNEDVLEIRRRYFSGNTTYRKLGKEFNVDHSQIGHIIKGRAWTHI